jgi:hypothetical protein
MNIQMLPYDLQQFCWPNKNASKLGTPERENPSKSFYVAKLGYVEAILTLLENSIFRALAL